MKSNLILLACFAAGIAFGYSGNAPEWLQSHELPGIILTVLVIQVGISLGGNKDLIATLKQVNPKMFCLPLFTVAGTLFFTAIGGLMLHGISLRDSLAVGSGFGYYSLSSVLISQMKITTAGAQVAGELATIALLANIIREMISLFGTPLITKRCGFLAPISVAGINSMDVCLPTIMRSTGKNELMPVAVLHGIVLEISVPLLISFFCC